MGPSVSRSASSARRVREVRLRSRQVAASDLDFVGLCMHNLRLAERETLRVLPSKSLSKVPNCRGTVSSRMRAGELWNRRGDVVEDDQLPFCNVRRVAHHRRMAAARPRVEKAIPAKVVKNPVWVQRYVRRMNTPREIVETRPAVVLERIISYGGEFIEETRWRSRFGNLEMFQSVGSVPEEVVELPYVSGRLTKTFPHPSGFCCRKHCVRVDRLLESKVVLKYPEIVLERSGMTRAEKRLSWFTTMMMVKQRSKYELLQGRLSGPVLYAAVVNKMKGGDRRGKYRRPLRGGLKLGPKGSKSKPMQRGKSHQVVPKQIRWVGRGNDNLGKVRVPNVMHQPGQPGLISTYRRASCTGELYQFYPVGTKSQRKSRIG